MNNTKYLYGAAVQGIQSFIFRTDKLTEMVGASILVDKICTDYFKESVQNFNEKMLLIGAAGNIKYLFENEEDCKSLVLRFPKKVMELAYGITISQAVIQVEGDLQIDHINQLEGKLKIQRNLQQPALDFGLMITERNRKTGVSAIKFEKNLKSEIEAIDKTTEQKRMAENDFRNELPEALGFKRFPSNFENMVQEGGKNWLAIIHADGNGLGRIIQRLGKELDGKTETELIETFSHFSNKLQVANIESTKDALSKLPIDKPERHDDHQLPFRPIILAGDDLTIVIRADLALEFTKHFLEAFEKYTKDLLGGIFKKYNLGIDGLTACAGISFSKTAFPFHYSYQLAEDLCKSAKRASKRLEDDQCLLIQPSSLEFFKVNASILSNYEDLVQSELTCNDGLSFKNGPYYLDNSFSPTIDELISKANRLTESGAPASQLRNWLSLRYHSAENAKVLMKRTIQVLGQTDDGKKMVESFDLNAEAFPVKEKTKSPIEPCPYYDYLAIASLIK